MIQQSYIPAVFSGFEHINRYWDKQNAISAAKITPGEYYVTGKGELITTVLGSCISVCVHDAVKGIGGMNHFTLPSAYTEVRTECEHNSLDSIVLHGNSTMEKLIDSILAKGGKRENLGVKVFGGADLKDMDTGVGEMNVGFIANYIAKEGYKLQAYDVRGTYPRKVVYYPHSGVVRVKILYELANDTLQNRERDYFLKLDNQSYI